MSLNFISFIFLFNLFFTTSLHATVIECPEKYPNGRRLIDGDILRYPDGSRIKDGEIWRYGGGARIVDGDIWRYKNGSRMIDGDIWRYETGHRLKDGDQLRFEDGTRATGDYATVSGVATDGSVVTGTKSNQKYYLDLEVKFSEYARFTFRYNPSLGSQPEFIRCSLRSQSPQS